MPFTQNESVFILVDSLDCGDLPPACFSAYVQLAHVFHCSHVTVSLRVEASVPCRLDASSV